MEQGVYQEIILIEQFYRSRVFDNFILADELFTKVLQNLETCLSNNNN